MTDHLETKGVQVVTADIKAAKQDDGSYDITLSVPSEDRDGEVIDAGALKWMSEGRMPIDVDHGMTVLTTVGSGLPVYDADALKLADFRWASTPFAQDVKILVDEGHVSKMSVAFMAAEREADEKDGKTHIRDGELLNAAIVAIPSNREANILVSKALAGLASRLPDSEKVGARNSAKDAEIIQTLHDSAAALGATCEGTTRSAEPSDTKTPDTDPEDTAAPAAVEPPADVDVAKALTDLSLVEADLALE